MPVRNRIRKISPEVEKREITSDVPINDYRGKENIDIGFFDAADSIDGRYATERQSFSDLLPPKERKVKGTKKQKQVKPKTRSKTKSIKATKNGKNSSFNFRESEEFPGDERGDIPFLPEIEGGKAPFNFLEPDGFAGGVVAGFPGAPPSQSFFEIMDDFFDEPKLQFPPPPPPQPHGS